MMANIIVVTVLVHILTSASFVIGTGSEDFVHLPGKSINISESVEKRSSGKTSNETEREDFVNLPDKSSNVSESVEKRSSGKTSNETGREDSINLPESTPYVAGNADKRVRLNDFLSTKVDNHFRDIEREANDCIFHYVGNGLPLYDVLTDLAKQNNPIEDGTNKFIPMSSLVTSIRRFNCHGDLKIDLESPVTQASWLRVKDIYLNVDPAGNKPFSGKGTATIDDTSYEIKFNYDPEASDFRVKLQAEKSAKMNVEQFLTLFDDPDDASRNGNEDRIKKLILTNENNVGIEFSNAVRGLTFRKHTITYTPSGDDTRHYAAYIESDYMEVKGDLPNPFPKHEMKRMTTILCIYDYIKNTKCALLGIVKSIHTSIFMNFFPNYLNHEGEKRSILDNYYNLPRHFIKQENEGSWFFMSSADTMTDLAPVEWYRDFKYDIFPDPSTTESTDTLGEGELVEDVHGTPSDSKFTGEGIIPGACFRYIKLYNGKNTAISMCPTRNSYKFYVDDGQLHSFRNILNNLFGTPIPKNDEDVNRWIKDHINKHPMLLDHVEVTQSDVYVYFKPRVTNITDTEHNTYQGFELIPRLTFTKIQNPFAIKISRSNLDKFSLERGAKEEFLGYDSDYTFIVDGKQTNVKFTFKIPSNTFLVKALRHEYKEMPGNYETDNQGEYKIGAKFESLKYITLKDLTMTTGVGVRYNYFAYSFEADAEIGDITDAKYNVVLDLQGTTPNTKSCLSRDNAGRLHEILDAINEKKVFDISWVGYKKIGFLYGESLFQLSDEHPCTIDVKTFVPEGYSHQKSTEEELMMVVFGIVFDCTVKVLVDEKTEEYVETTSKSCSFLKKMFPGGLEQVKLVGTMKKDEFKKIEGKMWSLVVDKVPGFNAPITADTITIERIVKKKGTGGTPINDAHFITYFQVRGTSTFSSNYDRITVVMTVFGEEVVMKLGCPECEDKFLLHSMSRQSSQVSNVEFEIHALPKGRQMTLDLEVLLGTIDDYQVDDHVDLLMRADLIMKSSKRGYQEPVEEIRFEQPQLTRQYIQFADVQHSKFFACQRWNHKIRIERLLYILGSKSNLNHFLKDALISDLCIIYNDKDADWYIPEVNRQFSRRQFYITGTVQTDLLTGGEKMYLPLLSEYGTIRFRNGQHIIDELLLCVTMPVLKWGQQQGTSNEGAQQQDTTRISNDVKEDSITDQQKEGNMVHKGDFKCYFNFNFGKGDGQVKATKPEISSDVDCIDFCGNKQKTIRSIVGVTMNTINGLGQCECVADMKRMSPQRNSKTCFLEESSRHLIQMYADKGQEEIGPQYCYRTLKNGDTLQLIRGYLNTFAFEMESAELVIFEHSGELASRVRPQSLVLYEDFKWEVWKNQQFKNMEVFNELEVASVYFDGSYTTGGIARMTFEIKINVLWKLSTRYRNQIITEFTKHVRKDIARFTTLKGKMKDILDKYQIWINDRGCSSLTDQQHEYYEAAERQRTKRSEAVQGYRRNCANECGYVRTPGWSIDKTCSKIGNSKPMNCLRYKRDANVASNVGCIANCEVERARSHIEARHMDAQVRQTIANTEVNDICRRKCYDVVKRMNEIKNTAVGDAKHLESILSRLQKAEETAADFPDTITKLSAYTTLIDKYNIPNERCMLFYLVFEPKDADRTYPLNRNLCFNGFIEMLTTEIYTFHYAYSNGRMYAAADAELSQITSILEEIENGEDVELSDAREVLQLNQEYEDCKNAKDSGTQSKRSNLLDAPEDFRLGDFNPRDINTVESFDWFSPWSMAKKQGIVGLLSNAQKSFVERNATYPVNESACSVAKRAVVDLNNIGSYLQQWTQEQAFAKRSISDLKHSTDVASKRHILSTSFPEQNYTDTQRTLLDYWSGKVDEGLKEWIATEEDHVNNFNSQSLPFIRKQLEHVYTDDDKHKTLSDFFTHRSVDGAHALKRANIDTASSNSYNELSKVLSEALLNGKSLEEISGQIDDVVRRSEMLHKRTIECQ